MSTRREQVMTLLVLAGLSAAFVAVIVLPGRNAHSALRSEIASTGVEISRGPVILARFREDRNALRRRLEYLDTSADAVAGPDGVLQAVSRIAGESGLDVVRIEPEASLMRESYTEHPFQLEYRATLGALTGFLQGLERSDRLFAVEDFSMRKGAEQSDGAELEGKIRFVVYAATNSSTTPAEENDSRG